MVNYYTDEKYIPEGLTVVRKNNEYFKSVTLEDTAEVRRVMWDIDGAEYVSPEVYKSSLTGTEVSVSNLSTGCKTALNVLYNPDICFDLYECTGNVLDAVLQMEEANILLTNWWCGPDEDPCNVTVNGERVCSNVKELMEVLCEIYEKNVYGRDEVQF